MGDPAKRRATYEDVLAAPDYLVAEIVDGVLITKPRPAPRHTNASSALGGELSGPFTRGKGVARTLEAFRLEGARWSLLGTWRDDAKIRVEPFESFELELEQLWAK